jgi:hypothetical protein
MSQHRSQMIARSRFVVLNASPFLGLADWEPGPLVAQANSNLWQFTTTPNNWFPDRGGDTGIPLGGNDSIDSAHGAIAI